MRRKTIIVLVTLGLIGSAGLIVTLRAQKQPGHTIPFATIDAGRYSNLLSKGRSDQLSTTPDDPTVFYEVILDNSRWQKLWSDYTQGRYPALPAPTLDFERNLVLFIILAPSGGADSIRVANISERQTRIEVSVVHLSHPHSSPTLGVITNPYQVVSLPKTGKPIVLTITRTSSNGE